MCGRMGVRYEVSDRDRVRPSPTRQQQPPPAGLEVGEEAKKLGALGQSQRL